MVVVVMMMVTVTAIGELLEMRNTSVFFFC